MAESTIHGDFGELVIETEMIEVTSNLPRPDKNWTYTDRQGHEHRWNNGYPTLIEKIDRTYWCEDCRDEHDERHLECRICGEHIEPGTLPPSPYPEFIPGRKAAYLNGEPISGERAEEIMREARGS